MENSRITGGGIENLNLTRPVERIGHTEIYFFKTPDLKDRDISLLHFEFLLENGQRYFQEDFFTRKNDPDISLRGGEAVLLSQALSQDEGVYLAHAQFAHPALTPPLMSVYSVVRDNVVSAQLMGWGDLYKETDTDLTCLNPRLLDRLGSPLVSN